ncbi:MAG: rod shape-determining protein MreC [Verrucomicrobiales bacterium]
MLKRPQFIALTFAVLLALVLLNLPSQATSQVKLVLTSFFLPLFGLTGSSQKAIDSAALKLTPKNIIIQELEQLRQDNQRLKLQVTQDQEIWRENELLRKAMAWQKNAPWNLKLARVITRDPANWWHNVDIDLGSRDGIVRNMPVMTADGLVGRVEQVGLTTSKVALVGDPSCRVAAVIENQSRDSGVIVPGGKTVGNESIVELNYLSRHSNAQPGQRVVTSGMGGIFPKGIPIGQIIDTNTVGFGLYLDARVKVAANLRELEMVWVLFPSPPPSL